MILNNHSIKKSFFSETAHIVRNAVSERCKFNVHGHSYQWNVTLYSNSLQDNGMVMDFKELKFIKDLVDLFDHSTVLWVNETNKVTSFFIDNFKRVIIMRDNCTAENMAVLLTNIIVNIIRNNDYYRSIIKDVEVEVYETKYSSALYKVDNVSVHPELSYESVTFFASDEIRNEYDLITQDNNCIIAEHLNDVIK